MEDSRQVPELVHVLRHSFRPSEQLGRTLEKFIPPESKRPSSFVEIKSLGALALDGYLHGSHAYTLNLIEARRAIERSQGKSLEIIPDIEVKVVNDYTVDVLMGVQSKLAMYLLNRTTKRFLPDAVSLRDEADMKFSVFARMHSSVPISPYFKEEAIEQYNEDYEQFGTKHLFNILPVGISGKDQHLRINRVASLDDTA